MLTVQKIIFKTVFWTLWIFWPRTREPWNLLFLGRWDCTLILKNVETHFTRLLSGLQPMCIVLFLCFDETRWEKAEKLGETPNVEVLRRFSCRDLQVTKVTTSEKKVNNHLRSIFWQVLFKKEDIFTWRWKKEKRRKIRTLFRGKKTEEKKVNNHIWSLFWTFKLLKWQHPKKKVNNHRKSIFWTFKLPKWQHPEKKKWIITFRAYF